MQEKLRNAGKLDPNPPAKVVNFKDARAKHEAELMRRWREGLDLDTGLDVV